MDLEELDSLELEPLPLDLLELESLPLDSLELELLPERELLQLELFGLEALEIDAIDLLTLHLVATLSHEASRSSSVVRNKCGPRFNDCSESVDSNEKSW